MPTPLFGMPENLPDDHESAMAAIQTWTDTYGRSVDLVTDGSTLGPFLRCDGAGNSWAVGTATDHSGTTIAYTLIGPTLIYTVRILNTALTIATAVNVIYLKLPPGMTARRVTGGMGTLVNAGASIACLLSTYAVGNPWISIQKHTAANFANDAAGGFSLIGQFACEVTRSE